MQKRFRNMLVRAALVLGGLVGMTVGLFFLTLPSAEPLRTENPRATALMDARSREALEKHRLPRRVHQWVPMSRISPWLRRAVVNSEDARFYEHDGFDVEETEAALEDAAERGHFARGASTITQQLAKNLWLGEERTVWRKLREYFLARRLEDLGKRRVLELYLNVAEWGDGVYGAEAAAESWFHKPALDLSPEESAVLAAMLPAPRRRNPQRPSARLRKRAFEVLELYGTYHQLAPEQLLDARERLADLLGTATAFR
ncbi:MAG TPA: monofunctional biosynthetic peptidoglycan transglycosylase [Myxococcales bacterium]|nr:monofunctional biosynthetic peptidoglycan transglycosylase [Myxococcales bacterium]